MKKITCLFCLTLLILASCSKSVLNASYQIIPSPYMVNEKQDENGFILSESVIIECPDSLIELAYTLNKYIDDVTGLTLKIKNIEGKRSIKLSLVNDSIPHEGYRIHITKQNISLQAADRAGLFYGIQTLRKSMPVSETKCNVNFPATDIYDYPQIAYRGAMMDVARSYYTLEEVKKFIDIITLHNINRLHLHLTDDQGWRVEIKKYPLLTQVGAFRNSPSRGEHYGGFYTQDELKQIVSYAAERYIEIIPEVDMPGHTLAALASYPSLGCVGNNYQVTDKAGVMPDILCGGNDSIPVFLKDVLTEIMNIFPSKYIHIGGDEVPRTRWENCPKCQAKIKELGLKSDKTSSAESKLQSYLNRELEKFLNNNNRSVIGWDDILEGGVSEDITVMSWRGIDGGIEAAKLGRRVIMAPNSSLYFDYYQNMDFENEPEAFGAKISLEDAFNTHITPGELTESQKELIGGVQCCLWSTWMPTFDIMEYQLLPRLAALSQIAWNGDRRGTFTDFLYTMPKMLSIYQSEGYKYCPSLYDISIEVTPDFGSKSVNLKLQSVDGSTIYYTSDGSEPTERSLKYETSVVILSDTKLRAVAILPNNLKSKELSKQITFNKATMKPIKSMTQTDPRYDVRNLVDGIDGYRVFTFGFWVGYGQSDLDIIVDMEKPTEISRFETTTLLDYGSHIVDAVSIEVLTSDDGLNFTSVSKRAPKQIPLTSSKALLPHELKFNPTTTRYVRVIIKCAKELPKDHVMYGQKPFLFVDEIKLF